jgi:hypothetical protein
VESEIVKGFLKERLKRLTEDDYVALAKAVILLCTEDREVCPVIERIARILSKIVDEVCKK